MAKLEAFLKELRSSLAKTIDAADSIAKALEAAEELDRAINDIAATNDTEFIAEQQKRALELKGHLVQAAAREGA